MTEESTEIKEAEPRHRNVILYFVRHGDAGYRDRQDMAGFLTEKGREQAKEAAKTLYQELPEGAVVEFISSNLNRAEETTEEMKKALEALNNDPQNIKKIFIHHGLPAQDGSNNKGQIKTFQRLAISDEHTDEYFKLSRDEEGNRQDAVTIWLENPGQSVEEIERDFRGVIRNFDRFSKHVSTGPDIYIVSTTHGGSADVVIGRLLGENNLGRLTNCEAFKVSLLANGQTHITFRDETKNISI